MTKCVTFERIVASYKIFIHWVDILNLWSHAHRSRFSYIWDFHYLKEKNKTIIPRRFQKIKTMSLKRQKTPHQVLPPWQGTNHTQRLDNVSSYQSPDIADLTEWERHLKPFIDSQWQTRSAYCISANQLLSVVSHTTRFDLTGHAGREVWSRKLKGWHDPTWNGEHQVSWHNPVCRKQGPSSSLSGVDASLVTFRMIRNRRK